MRSYSFTSNINGTITVEDHNDVTSIHVGGYLQSGSMVNEIWLGALEQLVSVLDIDKVLVLGFAGGSVVQALRTLWPGVSITAVEIDPIMITLAKRFFPENTKGVTIIQDDAFAYVKRIRPKRTYGLVIVDCYIADTEPRALKTISFFKKLKKITHHVLMNQLFISPTKAEMKKIEFLRDLDALYTVKVLKLPHNILISF